MVLTVAQCLDMALENDRLAAVVPKQKLKTQHRSLAEFYRNLAGEHAKLESQRHVRSDHPPPAYSEADGRGLTPRSSRAVDAAPGASGK